MKLKKLGQRSLPYFLIIIAALVILSPQISHHAFVSGYDYYFHMSRTYETAMQIKTGHFSYFLSLFSWNHSARIVNALYGPFGGYVSGLILLITGSWLHWEITMSFLVLILAGGTMYHLGRYWRLSPVIDFGISVLYMLSAPVKDYVFNQMFEGWGAALLPLLVLLASQMLAEKDISPLKFALILTLIIEVHLMTFVLSMIFMVPCSIIALAAARHIRKKLFRHLIKGSLLMLVLSFNVWGSILEVFGSNYHHVIPTFPGKNLGNKPYSSILNTYPKTSILQSPSLIGLGVAILIIMTVIMWLMNLKRVQMSINVFMLLGLFQIWLSSGYFPWTAVKHRAYAVATLIQFPKRFLPLGLILIYLGAGYLLSIYNGKQAVKNVGVIFLLALIGWGWRQDYKTYQTYVHTYMSSPVINWHRYTNMQWLNRTSPRQLRSSLLNNHPGQFLSTVISPVPDYLPTSTVYRHPAQYKQLDSVVRYQRTYDQSTHFEWTPLSHGREMIQMNAKRPQVRTVPFVKYAHTQVMLNHHEIQPRINRVGAMRLHLKPGKNRLIMQYRPNLGFKIGMLISVVMWIIIIISFIL